MYKIHKVRNVRRIVKTTITLGDPKPPRFGRLGSQNLQHYREFESQTMKKQANIQKLHILSKSPQNIKKFYYVSGHEENLNKFQILYTTTFSDHYARKLDVKHKIYLK